MRYNFRYTTCLVALGCLCLLGTGCRKRVSPTTLRLEDPVRHYYPLVQGEDLRMNYKIVNTGNAPFIIQDIQPASLSIEFTKTPPHLIPRGDSIYLSMVYHTDRNIGFAEHKIRIFGNVVQVNDSAVLGEAVLTFDTHIVRPTVDQSDYEERYWEKKAKNEKLVDGDRGMQGYYTDEDVLREQQEGNYEMAPNHHRDQQVKQTTERVRF